MVGVILALSLQAPEGANTEDLVGVHTIVTDSSEELLEQVLQLQPEVLLLDAYHAKNQELLTTFRKVTPWGYLVLVCQQPSDLQFANGVDEVWPITTLDMKQIRLLLRLARLNRYRNEHRAKCIMANEAGRCDGSRPAAIEAFFIRRARLISPGAWARRFFEKWDFLLQHLSRASAVKAISPWPDAISAEKGQFVYESRSTFSSIGLKLDPLFDTGGLLLSVSFEGAYFPVAVVWGQEKAPPYSQLVAEAAAGSPVGPYSIFSLPLIQQLLNDVIYHVIKTLTQQYALALYSFGQCVFCRGTITDKAFYDAISAALDLGIVLLDVAHNIVYANEQAVRLLMGETVVTESAGVKLPLLDKILDKLPDAKEKSPRLNISLSAPEGRRLAANVAPALSGEGEKLGYVVTIQEDVKTSEPQLESRLRDRLASVGELAAGMAHEIRNPLTSIRGFMQLLRQGLISNQMEVETRYVDYALEEIDRANHVVTNFLTLAKPKDEAWQQVDINELLAKMLHLVENQAMLKGVYLTWQFSPNLALIRGQAEALVQVFLNIVTNALQATSKGGAIHILTRQLDDHVLISVHDTGTGMSPAVQKRIFNPFYSTKEGGTGLGLALCKQIIEEHRGDIQVTSQVGVGSCFTISLPIA
ncbi:MAG: GHKL domain-containing protein [Firmicutes bacterium]|nr:GHKL domain-containing protein [Bacillota bacterium]